MDESFIIGSITSHADFKTAFFKLHVGNWVGKSELHKVWDDEFMPRK